MLSRKHSVTRTPVSSRLGNTTPSSRLRRQASVVTFVDDTAPRRDTSFTTPQTVSVMEDADHANPAEDTPQDALYVRPLHLDNPPTLDTPTLDPMLLVSDPDEHLFSQSLLSSIASPHEGDGSGACESPPLQLGSDGDGATSGEMELFAPEALLEPPTYVPVRSRPPRHSETFVKAMRVPTSRRSVVLQKSPLPPITHRNSQFRYGGRGEPMALSCNHSTQFGYNGSLSPFTIPSEQRLLGRSVSSLVEEPRCLEDIDPRCIMYRGQRMRVGYSPQSDPRINKKKFALGVHVDDELANSTGPASPRGGSPSSPRVKGSELAMMYGSAKFWRGESMRNKPLELVQPASPTAKAQAITAGPGPSGSPRPSNAPPTSTAVSQAEKRRQQILGKKWRPFYSRMKSSFIDKEFVEILDKARAVREQQVKTRRTHGARLGSISSAMLFEEAIEHCKSTPKPDYFVNARATDSGAGTERSGSSARSSIVSPLPSWVQTKKRRDPLQAFRWATGQVLINTRTRTDKVVEISRRIVAQRRKERDEKLAEEARIRKTHAAQQFFAEAFKRIKNPNRRQRLTEAKYLQLRQQFRDLDDDNSGMVSLAEVQAVFDATGDSSQFDAAMFRRIDKDRSGVLELDEVLHAMYPNMTTREIRLLMEKWDAAQMPQKTHDEAMREQLHPDIRADIERIFRLCDRGHKGALSRQDLSVIVPNPDWQLALIDMAEWFPDATSVITLDTFIELMAPGFADDKRYASGATFGGSGGSTASASGGAKPAHSGPELSPIKRGAIPKELLDMQERTTSSLN